MTEKLSALICCLALLLAGCSDEIEVIQPEEEAADEPQGEMAESVSYWDLLGDLNKIEDLHLEIIPPQQPDGDLPRSTGDFYLGMQLPREGDHVRDMEVLMLQEKGSNRRVRLFSSEGSVYRISCYTKKSVAIDSRDTEELFEQVRSLYGTPDKQIENQHVYIDDHTVLTFKAGGIFWIVEIEDIDRGTFSEDILLLIDEQYEEMVQERKQSSNQ